jgi:phosphatidylinositol glycan class T
MQRCFSKQEMHPHDASRGTAVAPAIASMSVNGSRRYASSAPSLTDAYLPDFSMPFNAMTLTSSAMAFFVGSVINLFFKTIVAQKNK